MSSVPGLRTHLFGTKMKGQDILILLKLVSLQQEANKNDYSERFLIENCSARALESSLGVSKTEVNASINRSIEAGLAAKDRRNSYPKANIKPLLEFVLHGIKYVFPAKPGKLVRGIPTAFDAPVLRGDLYGGGEFIHVWPDVNSQKMGQLIKPLFKSVPFAVSQDPRLYTFLALVDAIRLGNPREVKIAQKVLKERLLHVD